MIHVGGGPLGHGARPTLHRVAPRAARVRTAAFLQEREELALEPRGAQASRTSRQAPPDRKRLCREREDHDHSRHLGLPDHLVDQRDRFRRLACRGQIEQVGQRVAGAYSGHGFDSRHRDQLAVAERRELLQLSAQQREVIAAVTREERRRVGRDRRGADRLRLMRDPPQQLVVGERPELDGARHVDQVGVRLRARGKHEHEAGVGRWRGEIAREALTHRLLERVGIAQDHHAAFGEHRQRLECARETGPVALGAAKQLQIEIPRGGVGRARDQRAHLLLLQEVIRAVEQVDGVQARAVERGLERLHRHGSHRRAI